MHAAIRAAKTVIVQFNRVDAADARRELHPRRRHRPRRRGRRRRRTSTRSAQIGDVERRIGEFVADLVPDGATLQLGIGAIPAATALALRDKRDLGIHTEMFTDAVVDLVEAGVVTGARKERNRGKIVTAFLMGIAAAVRLRRRQPDGRDALGRLHERHRTSSARSAGWSAINSAIEVDLTGQVVADSIGHAAVLRRRRPDGLHPRRGARDRGPGDHRPAVDGRRRHASRGSRPTLKPGAGVVTTRAHVRTVVTEWGVAELFGKSMRERAEALIAIAHPDFRDELAAEAEQTDVR